MGVSNTKLQAALKSTAVTATPASGAAATVDTDSVAIVVMLGAADLSRKADAVRRLRECQQHIKDNNLMDTATALNVMAPIGGDKTDITVEALASAIVDGNVAVQIGANVRVAGSDLNTDNSIRELIDFALENERITS